MPLCYVALKTGIVWPFLRIFLQNYHHTHLFLILWSSCWTSCNNFRLSIHHQDIWKILLHILLGYQIYHQPAKINHAIYCPLDFCLPLQIQPDWELKFGPAKSKIANGIKIKHSIHLSPQGRFRSSLNGWRHFLASITSSNLLCDIGGLIPKWNFHSWISI